MRNGNSSWKMMHIERLRYIHGENYHRWNGQHDDDRGLYCKLYESMEAALRSLPAEPVKYVAVAMEAKMRKDRATMDRIARRFRVIEAMELDPMSGQPGSAKEACFG